MKNSCTGNSQRRLVFWGFWSDGGKRSDTQEECRVSTGAGQRGSAVSAEANPAEESQTQRAEQLKAGHVTIALKSRQKSSVQEMAIQKTLNHV